MSLSTFPTTLDSFVEHYEIQASDVSNLNTYQQLLTTANLTPAQQTQLNNLQTELADKLFRADDLNKLQDCIVNIENFLNTEIDAYINTTVQNGVAQITQVKNDAINYIDGTTAGNLQKQIGILSNLATNTQSDIVSAINEILQDITTDNQNLQDTINSEIGTMSGLTTPQKDNLTDAINSIQTEVGTLSSLQTTAKDNLVDAVNEANNHAMQWYIR